MNVKKIVGNSKIVNISGLGSEDNGPSKKIVEEMEENKIVGILAQNLSIRLTKMDLMKEFKAIGEIHCIDMHVDATGFPRESAIIKFEDPEDVIKAHGYLNGKLLDGQCIKLIVLREKRENSFLRMLHETRNKRKSYTHDIDMYVMSRFQKKLCKLKKEMNSMLYHTDDIYPFNA